MTLQRFKVQDKDTGLFWNGDYRNPNFNEVGKSWNFEHQVEKELMYHIKCNIYHFENKDYTIPASWIVMKFELTEVFQSSDSVSNFLSERLLKEELNSISWRLNYFYDKMKSKGVMDNIEYIIMLVSPSDSIERHYILEARAQLRLLGIKTRTFREYNGMFGMLNKDQAMRARLTLNVDKFIDLNMLRKKVNYQAARNL